MDNKNAEAIEMVDRLRHWLTGNGQVTLRLGADGNKVCELRDSDGTVGRGEDGKSLLGAVQAANCDWLCRKLIDTDWGRKTVMGCVKTAIETFNGPVGVFCTEDFYASITNPDAYAEITKRMAVEILKRHPRIVRLREGSLWTLLPGSYERYATGEVAPE